MVLVVSRINIHSIQCIALFTKDDHTRPSSADAVDPISDDGSFFYVASAMGLFWVEFGLIEWYIINDKIQYNSWLVHYVYQESSRLFLETSIWMLIMYHSSLTLEYARGPNQGKREKRQDAISRWVGWSELRHYHHCIAAYHRTKLYLTIVPYHRTVPSYRTTPPYYRSMSSFTPILKKHKLWLYIVCWFDRYWYTGSAAQRHKCNAVSSSCEWRCTSKQFSWDWGEFEVLWSFVTSCYLYLQGNFDSKSKWFIVYCRLWIEKCWRHPPLVGRLPSWLTFLKIHRCLTISLAWPLPQALEVFGRLQAEGVSRNSGALVSPTGLMWPTHESMRLFSSPRVPATNVIPAPPLRLDLEDVFCLLGDRAYVCFGKVYGVCDWHLAPDEEVFCARAGLELRFFLSLDLQASWQAS